MTVTFLPLLRAQARPHMPVPDIPPISAADLIDRAAAARARLLGGNEPEPATVKVRTIVVGGVRGLAPRHRDIIDLYDERFRPKKRRKKQPVGLMPEWPASTKRLRAALQRKQQAAELYPLLIAVAETHGVSVEALSAPTRRPHVCRARHEFCYIACEERGFSTNAVAVVLKRDRTSVLHGIKAHKALIGGAA